jgi:hypothetical protein
MFAALSFAALTATSQSGPLERYKSFRAASPSVSVDLKLSSDQLGGSGIGSYAFSPKYEQAFRVKWRDMDMEMKQDAESKVLILYHHNKTYDQYGKVGRIAPPHPDWNYFVTASYPGILTTPSLGDFASLYGISGGSSAWSVKSTDEAKGTDLVVLSVGGQFDASSRIEVTIDTDGKPLVYESWHEESIGQVHVRVEMSNFRTAKTASKIFSTALPFGYSPEQIPQPHTALSPGGRFTVDPLVDGASGKRHSLKSLYGKKGVAIMITSPDCEISVNAEKEMREVRQLLAKADIEMIEVSIGEGRPAKRDRDPNRILIWDQSGEIDRLTDVPATPWFIRLDPDGVVQSAWGGWKPGSAKQIAETLAGIID